jgi:hypothetical protein
MAIVVDAQLKRWLYIVFVLFIALPLIIALVFWQQVSAWYVVDKYAPSLQRDLGFTVDQRAHPIFGENTFFITSVVPNGVFQRAGIQGGDAPYGYKHGAAVGFYMDLERNRGSSVTLKFLRPPHNEGFPTHLEFTVVVPRRGV